MKTRSRQSGSVISFIVIGVVLVIMTAGVLYWVRHKDAPVTTPPKTPGVTLPGAPEATPPKGDDKTPQPDTTSDAPAGDSTPQTTPSDNPATAPTDVTALSQTGSGDTALQLIAIGALVAVTAGFVRSRSQRSSL
ncbi:MAG: hypothetical protein JWM00_233 [Candidatus Saccharibacteria bacterium]|nr:hypothetical protein [Candidatus Saccharibacteria bacterium]